MNLRKISSVLSSRQKQRPSSRPVIFNLAVNADRSKLSNLLAGTQIRHVVDDYREQLHELFAIKNPTRVYTPNFEMEFDAYYRRLARETTISASGRWVYFPWISTLVHILTDTDFQVVRTARNRNLITTDEQQKFYNSTVGIGGLSVGNSVILTIVLQGGARRIRLADPDRLALTNTNRIRGGVESLGLPKVEMAARQIYLINPFAKVEFFSEGLTRENIEKFFSGPPKLDVVIDELDNLAMKYLIREKAKKHRVPLVMGADNGDNAVVDIERYDLSSRLPFFHGRIGKTSFRELKNLDKFGIGKTIARHIGAENVTAKMQDSLLQMGKTIVSWPQLGGAALINGSAVAYCVRRILNGQPLERNRAVVSLDEKFVPGYASVASRGKRKKMTERFKKIIGL